MHHGPVMCPKIVFDRTNCEGFNVCAAMDPDRWKEVPDEKKVDLVGANEVSDGRFELEITEDQVDDATSAAEGCPAEVIKVLANDGKVLAGPKQLPIEQ